MFDGHSDARLALFAADLLREAGRRDEAAAALKRAFDRAPDFNVYLRWREIEGTVRDQALALLERLSAMMTRKYRVSRTVREGLARASEADCPREVLNVYAERVDELANGGGNRAYEESAGLVARMGRLRAEADQRAYVATLKQRFGLKRNFMKLLG